MKQMEIVLYRKTTEKQKKEEKADNANRLHLQSSLFFATIYLHQKWSYGPNTKGSA